MAKKQKMWVYNPSKPPAPKVSANTKVIVQQKADELVDRVLSQNTFNLHPLPMNFSTITLLIFIQSVPKLFLLLCKI